MRVKSTKAHTSITLSPRPNAGIRKKQFLVVEEGRYGASGLRRKRVEESYTFVDTVTRKQTMADCRWWCTPSLLLVCLALLARTSSAQDVTVGFTETSVSVPEDAGSVSLRVSLNQSLVEDEFIELSVMVINDTAFNPGDFSAIPSPDVLLFNSTSGDNLTVTVAIVDDTDLEGAESFSVMLVMGNANVSIVQMNDIVTVTIEDNEREVALVVMVPRMVAEDVGTIMACARISSLIPGGAVVTISTSDGTATSPEDYLMLSENVTVGNTSNLVCVPISIVNDNLLEADQNFNVVMTTMDPRLSLVNATVEVVIVSDPADRVNVSLVPSVIYLTRMKTNFSVGVAVSSNVQRYFSVNVTAMLVMEDPYIISPLQVSLQEGGAPSSQVVQVLTFNSDTTQMVDVFLTHDPCIQPTQFVNVFLTTSDEAVMLTAPVVQFHTVETENVSIGFGSPDVVRVTEGMVAMVPVRISEGCVGVRVNLSINVVDLTPGVMMELNVYPETVIFNGSSNVSYVRVTSPSDTVLENNGYFTLSLSLASPSSIMNNVVLSPNSINVTAVDNAANVTVGLNMSLYEVTEGSSFYVCVVVVSGSLEREAVFTIGTMNDSALENVDFSGPAPDTIVLNSSTSSSCVRFETVRNNVVQENKMFMVMLETTEGVKLATSMALVNITEADSVTIGLSETFIEVVEGRSFMLCANVTAGTLGRSLPVRITTEDDTAEASSDYMAVNVPGTLNNSESTVCVTVSTNTDNRTDESSETFRVRLTSDVSPPVVIISPGVTMVTIMDAPFILLEPEDLFLLPGDDASFRVGVTGGSLSYQWRLDGQDLADMEGEIGGSSTPNLTVYNVSDADLGLYSCFVSNLAASVSSRNATLGFVEPPMNLIGSDNTGVLLGNSVDINCTVESLDGAASITWVAINSLGGVISLPDPVTSMSGTTISSTITISDANSSYSGNYTCTAMNRVTSVSRSFRVGVITVGGVNNVTVVAGQSASFFCDASGDPDLMYRWSITRNIDLVSRSTIDRRFVGIEPERIDGDGTANLTINNVTGFDNHNNTERIGCTVLLFEQELTVLFGEFFITPVNLIAGPMDITVVENTTANFSCTAENPEGAPYPLQFSWKVNASGLVDLEGSDGRIITTEEVNGSVVTGYLIFTKTVPSDFGEYRCFVTNFRRGDTVSSGDAILTIQFAPVVTRVMVSIENQFQDPVEDNLFPVDAGGESNRVVVLYVGEPRVTSSGVSLFLVGTDDSRENVTNCTVQMESNNVNSVKCLLPVLNLTTEMSNPSFQIELTNSIGTTTVMFSLLVQDVPDPVDLAMLQAFVVDLLRVRLTWRPPMNNRAPITSYTVTLCHEVNNNNSICTPAGSEMVLPNSTVPTTPGGASDDRIQAIVEHGAGLGNFFLVNISANNRVGDGGFMNGPARVATATIANAAPIRVRTTGLTSSFAVVVWDLPTTAMGEGIVVSGYTISIDFTNTDTDPDPRNTSAGARAIQLLATEGLEGGATVNITVTTDYQTPSVSDATSPVFSFLVPIMDADVQPILPNGVALPTSTSGIQSNIGWPSLPNKDFLTGFQVNYENRVIVEVESRQRRKRQATAAPPGPGVVMVSDVNAMSAPIPTCSFCSVTAGVNAVYQGGVTAPLVPPVTFITPESMPTVPRNLVVTSASVHTLSYSWDHPSPTNGIITSYTVIYHRSVDSSNQANNNQLPNNATTYDISDLDPNTMYMVYVFATNRITNSASTAGVPGRTLFGVTRPSTVTLVASGSTFTATFTVSRSEGDVQEFQIIVSRTKISDSTSNANILPYSSATQNLYVTRVGTVASGATTVRASIGTGETSTSAGTSYVDQRLEGDTDYYVIIRLFSSIDTNVFNDSVISTAIRHSPGLNIVLVIAPIAAIAAVLIVILVVLLVVAYCTLTSPLKRIGGYMVTNDVQKRQGGKGGAAMELRRTRLFSPVLNVGTPDVFTSADQPTTLICEASGTPAPVVTWSHSGEPLDKERFIQLADHSLFINDTDLQDEGTYTVRAVNSAGESEEYVRMTVLRPIPPESDPDHPPIKVGEFSEKIALVRADDDEGLEDEYTEVELDWTFTSYTAKLNINKNKNRYINIIPYDHSRVVLSLQDSTPGSDYINASFVDAFQRPNGYIASQGPIPSTFPDFWRMIWELDAPTIVMVTNLKEEDKIKCHQYWPSYGTTTYGNIQVTLKEVENLAEYSIRTFNVSPLAGQSRVQMPVREVRQFHFLVWPDHGVPTYATNLLSFRKRILKYHPEKRGPMVVHCSAGVGRTGTFITIDFMLKQMEAEGTINIFNFVRHMRYRRNYMVQTSSQYVFIHDALLESIMCGDNSIKAPELKKKVEELRQVVPETGVSTFETQFNTLMTASPPYEDFDCSIAELPDNASKNRSKANLPANDYRVVLSSDNGQSDYICASYVDNYRERNAFIVTQGPLEETVNDFWRMIWETKSAAIVMLTELEEDGQEMSVKYWPTVKDEPRVCGGYQVQLSEEEKDRGDYITRRFKIFPVDKTQESRMVSQFHFIRWTKSTPPKDCRPMIDLIDELQRVQRKSGNMPITVHCDDGIGRTGAFCTLYSVLERVKTEQIVDVFQAVKTLRIQRTGLMATIHEYEFVHCAVIEFLETFSEYQNFK